MTELKTDTRLLKTAVSSSNNFLIRQTSDREFIILKMYKEIETKGYLWWKKTIKTEKYHRVDKYGTKFFIISYPIYFTNLENLETYKTKEDAEKWIADYTKYPLDYYC
jgi:hypothetical protein